MLLSALLRKIKMLLQSFPGTKHHSSRRKCEIKDTVAKTNSWSVYPSFARVPDKYNTQELLLQGSRFLNCIMEMTLSQTAGTWGTAGNTSRTHRIGRCVGKEEAPNWLLDFGRRCSPCCSPPALLTRSPPTQPFQAGRGLQSFHRRKSHLERMYCCWQTWTVAGGGKMGKIRRKKPTFTNISFPPSKP